MPDPNRVEPDYVADYETTYYNNIVNDRESIQWIFNSIRPSISNSTGAVAGTSTRWYIDIEGNYVTTVPTSSVAPLPVPSKPLNEWEEEDTQLFSKEIEQEVKLKLQIKEKFGGKSKKKKGRVKANVKGSEPPPDKKSCKTSPIMVE